MCKCVSVKATPPKLLSNGVRRGWMHSTVRRASKCLKLVAGAVKRSGIIVLIVDLATRRML